MARPKSRLILGAKQRLYIESDFAVALNTLTYEDKDIVHVESTFNGKATSAVIVVVGAESTRQVLKLINKLMDRWKQPAD